MNIVLFRSEEIEKLIPASDRRVRHISRILKKRSGEEFEAGIIEGERGRARILSLDRSGLLISFEAGGKSPELLPLTLILGFPRPIQANRILKDLSSLGVSRIILSGTEYGEKSYMESNFFRNEGWREALIEGAEQSATTLLPGVEWDYTLKRSLERLLDTANSELVALDNVKPSVSLSAMELTKRRAVLCIGSERGWSEAERERLSAAGFVLASLGTRVLKTETACLIGSALVLGKLGCLD
jgi:16S rRNA (uracil1498-N3)-methyltransferase